MEDYIRRVDALSVAAHYCPDDDGSCLKAGADIRELLDDLEDIPAADVDAMPHGEWKRQSCSPHQARYKCSRCGIEVVTHGVKPWERYCPWCGSDMDGEQYNLQDTGFEDGRFEMFEEISSAYHGKQYYYRQSNGLIYSRESGEYLTMEEAIIEFTRHINSEEV